MVVGDALGVPNEFKDRHHFDMSPVTDMEGYGTYNQEPGVWSDDSSLTLATLDGLSSVGPLNEDKRFSDFLDYDDVMSRFCDWYFNAEYTPKNDVFDVGGTTLDAILEFHNSSVDALEAGGKGERSNGNGSLMRIIPAALLIHYASLKYSFSLDEKMEIVHNLSKLTHGHKRSQMACGIYVIIAIELLKSRESDEDLMAIVDRGIEIAKDFYSQNDEFEEELEHFDRVFSLEIPACPIDDIKSGGYVISSLEASIWCLSKTNSYNDAVLKAVNLGHDTDTTAAICGALAGIYYGIDNISQSWLDTIVNKKLIDDLIDKFTKNLEENL